MLMGKFQTKAEVKVVKNNMANQTPLIIPIFLFLSSGTGFIENNTGTPMTKINEAVRRAFTATELITCMRA